MAESTRHHRSIRHGIESVVMMQQLADARAV